MEEVTSLTKYDSLSLCILLVYVGFFNKLSYFKKKKKKQSMSNYCNEIKT
jgi:hypothetical protein